jgi:hypothetical protein
MLEIKPSTDIKRVAGFCRKLGRVPSEAYYLYTAENAGKSLASCLFEVGGEAVTFLLYECEDKNDYWLFDGILRAGFNYAFEHGINTGRIPEEQRHKYEGLFAKLNYPAAPEFDITNFFKKYKNCR